MLFRYICYRGRGRGGATFLASTLPFSGAASATQDVRRRFERLGCGFGMQSHGSASTGQQSEFSGFWFTVFDLARKVMLF